jgi:hypothetical protein
MTIYINPKAPAFMPATPDSIFKDEVKPIRVFVPENKYVNKKKEFPHVRGCQSPIYR